MDNTKQISSVLSIIVRVGGVQLRRNSINSTRTGFLVLKCAGRSIPNAVYLDVILPHLVRRRTIKLMSFLIKKDLNP